MKLKPMLYSTLMVQAILAGRKTMTRRIVKHFGNSIHIDKLLCDWGLSEPPYIENGILKWTLQTEVDDARTFEMKLPYQKGDILWVRETFFALGKWIKNGTTKTGKQKYKFVDLTVKMNRKYMYLTDSEKPEYVETKKDGLIHWYKRPSIFMPFVAARIFLEVTDVRVERLQDISEVDAKSEGVIPFKAEHESEIDCWTDGKHKTAFNYLWNEINGWNPDSFESNPWVWVISFNQIEKPC